VQRVGVVVASYAEFMGLSGVAGVGLTPSSSASTSASTASLDRFAMGRFLGDRVGALRSPSDQRYVDYFAGLLSGRIRVNSAPLYLHHVTAPFLRPRPSLSSSSVHWHITDICIYAKFVVANSAPSPLPPLRNGPFLRPRPSLSSSSVHWHITEICIYAKFVVANSAPPPLPPLRNGLFLRPRLSLLCSFMDKSERSAFTQISCYPNRKNGNTASFRSEFRSSTKPKHVNPYLKVAFTFAFCLILLGVIWWVLLSLLLCFLNVFQVTVVGIPSFEPNGGCRPFVKVRNP